MPRSTHLMQSTRSTASGSGCSCSCSASWLQRCVSGCLRAGARGRAAPRAWLWPPPLLRFAAVAAAAAGVAPAWGRKRAQVPGPTSPRRPAACRCELHDGVGSGPTTGEWVQEKDVGWGNVRLAALAQSAACAWLHNGKRKQAGWEQRCSSSSSAPPPRPGKPAPGIVNCISCGRVPPAPASVPGVRAASEGWITPPAPAGRTAAVAAVASAAVEAGGGGIGGNPAAAAPKAACSAGRAAGWCWGCCAGGEPSAAPSSPRSCCCCWGSSPAWQVFLLGGSRAQAGARDSCASQTLRFFARPQRTPHLQLA